MTEFDKKIREKYLDDSTIFNAQKEKEESFNDCEDSSFKVEIPYIIIEDKYIIWMVANYEG